MKASARRSRATRSTPRRWTCPRPEAIRHALPFARRHQTCHFRNVQLPCLQNDMQLSVFCYSSIQNFLVMCVMVLRCQGDSASWCNLKLGDPSLTPITRKFCFNQLPSSFARAGADVTVWLRAPGLTTRRPGGTAMLRRVCSGLRNAWLHSPVHIYACIYRHIHTYMI